MDSTALLVSQAPSTGLSARSRILIAEDSAAAREGLQRLLEGALGIAVDTAADGGQALEALTARPYSIVLTDLEMPRVGGMKLLEEVRKRRLPVAVVVTTGYGGIDEAVRAMRLGATDFLTKPIDVDHLRLVVERALRERALQDEVAELREQLHDRFAFRGILSKSPAMQRVFELIAHVGQTASTVLIQGETGTGKELVARAVHQASPGRSGPFVAVNCAALPETLLESELFGHEKGSFTGAAGQRKGRFELADGGTLFLDEVGDVPAAMQAKLLRVLQERRFERVGGSKSVEVDVRVVAATNRPLREMVQDEKFREDLYYRINVVRIDLPPLRDRAEDIPLLAVHFAEKFARPGEAPKQITPEAMELLLRYRWPGNIRELENAVERSCVTSRDGTIRPENLPVEVTQSPRRRVAFSVDVTRPLDEQLAALNAAFEERYLRRALRKCRGSLNRASRLTGLSRREIAAKVERYKIDPSDFSKS